MRAKTTACYCRALDMYYVHAVGCVSFMHYGSTDYALSGDTTEAAPECSLQRPHAGRSKLSRCPGSRSQQHMNEFDPRPYRWHEQFAGPVARGRAASQVRARPSASLSGRCLHTAVSITGAATAPIGRAARAQRTSWSRPRSLFNPLSLLKRRLGRRRRRRRVGGALGSLAGALAEDRAPHPQADAAL